MVLHFFQFLLTTSDLTPPFSTLLFLTLLGTSRTVTGFGACISVDFGTGAGVSVGGLIAAATGVLIAAAGDLIVAAGDLIVAAAAAGVLIPNAGLSLNFFVSSIRVDD